MNYAGISLKPTYDMGKGSEVDTPLSMKLVPLSFFFERLNPSDRSWLGVFQP